MSEEKEAALIRKLAKELALASHQSRDKEVSGLFREIKSSLNALESDVSSLRKAVEGLESDYKEKILPNVNTWNSTSDNVGRVVWVVVSAVILALLALIGLR